MNQSTKIGISLTAAVLMTACSSPPLTPSSAPVDAPVTRLVPQPEGTPLPPRDLRVADHWPPELKQTIDNLLSLYPKDGKPLGVADVEKKMGITLTEIIKPEGNYPLYKTYRVSGTRYNNPDLERVGFGANYNIYRAQSPGGMTQSLKLAILSPQNRFCLDPYELAVYTGSKFFNGSFSFHSINKVWPAAYVWGMFEWSEDRSYIGQNFSIVTGRDRTKDEASKASCVVTISVSGKYIKE